VLSGTRVHESCSERHTVGHDGTRIDRRAVLGVKGSQVQILSARLTDLGIAAGQTIGGPAPAHRSGYYSAAATRPSASAARTIPDVPEVGK
jgi:hypothetical protein